MGPPSKIVRAHRNIFLYQAKKRVSHLRFGPHVRQFGGSDMDGRLGNRWETLVVDVVGLRRNLAGLAGLVQSSNMHVVERFRREETR